MSPASETAGVDPRSRAAPRPSALHGFLLVTAWLPRYDYRGLLRLDVIAGATVWGLLVPEMIAYSGLAGLPPEAGLYTLLPGGAGCLWQESLTAFG